MFLWALILGVDLVICTLVIPIVNYLFERLHFLRVKMWEMLLLIPFGCKFSITAEILPGLGRTDVVKGYSCPFW
jgi:hypothetical protein